MLSNRPGDTREPVTRLDAHLRILEVRHQRIDGLFIEPERAKSSASLVARHNV